MTQKPNPTLATPTTTTTTTSTSQEHTHVTGFHVPLSAVNIRVRTYYNQPLIHGRFYSPSLHYTLSHHLYHPRVALYLWCSSSGCPLPAGYTMFVRFIKVYGASSSSSYSLSPSSSSYP